MQKQHTNLIILTLMITMIIDIMGIGLILPTLAQLFLDSNSIFTAQIQSVGMKNVLFGLSLAAWPLGLLIGGPMLGHLSDELGRKRIIAGCLFMTAVTYGLAAISIELASCWLFIAARFLSGFFAGSFELAQAAVSDISPPEKKARNMGWIVLAASLGFVIGPLISGLTTNPAFARWFSLATPFWIATALSFLNMISILILLKETYVYAGKIKVDIMACVTSIAFIFKDKRVRYIGVVFFILQFAWAMYMYSLTAFLNVEFHYGPTKTGLFYALFGAGFGIGTIIVQPIAQKYMSLKSMSVISMLVTAVILVFAVYPGTELLQWVVAFFGAMIEILAYTGCMALISNLVGEKEQGTAMGGAGSIFAFSWMISSFLIGPTLSIYWSLPMAITAVCLLLGGVLLIFKKIESH